MRSNSTGSARATAPPPWTGAPPVPEKMWAWVTEQTHQAERVLFDEAGGCRFCRRGPERDASRRQLPVFFKSQINSRAFPKIGDSSRWFPLGSFHHERHRML